MAKEARGSGPVLLPPMDGDGNGSSDTGGESAPSVQMEEPGLTAVGPDSGPSLQPPAEVLSGTTAGQDGVTSTWRNGVKVDALWTVEETRNAWIRIVDVGWKRIHNGRDGAFLALVTLASQARQTGRSVNVREESGGIIHEIYLW